MAGREPPEPTTYGSLSPEAALALLGHEVRAEILWALSEAREELEGPPSLSFSELRSRVAPDMDSSQFNYHLQELVGHFVERRGESGRAESQLVEEMAGEHGGGYALRPEGTVLTRTIRAMTFTGDAAVDPFRIGLDCYYCGTPVEAAYGNAIFKIQCPECAYLYDYNLTPPGVVAEGEARPSLWRSGERRLDGHGSPGPADGSAGRPDHETVLSRVARYNRHVRFAFADGVCPTCAHDVGATFEDAGETDYPRSDRREVLVGRRCGHCGEMDVLTVGECVLRDPELVAFCHERGVDVAREPIWRLEFAATDRHTSVRSRDPWEVAVEVELSGDALELVVDGDLAVVERNHE